MFEKKNAMLQKALPSPFITKFFGFTFLLRKVKTHGRSKPLPYALKNCKPLSYSDALKTERISSSLSGAHAESSPSFSAT